MASKENGTLLYEKLQESGTDDVNVEVVNPINVEIVDATAKFAVPWLQEVFGSPSCIKVGSFCYGNTAEARDVLWVSDTPDSKQGRKLLKEQLRHLQMLRGFVEECKQKAGITQVGRGLKSKIGACTPHDFASS